MVQEKSGSIETMRAVAVLLLVSYHVIGVDETSGLGLGYPHSLRLFADFFVDIRMPLFAFIAGYVHGLRPVSPGRYQAFLVGKFQRLLIPGAVAVTAFALAAGLVGNEFQRSLDGFWRIYVFPYAHFWFLQSIFLIFILLGAIEARFRDVLTPILLGLSMILYLAGAGLGITLFSLSGVSYLLPFFLLGRQFVRMKDLDRQRKAWLIGLSLAVIALTSLWNVAHLQTYGEFSPRRDLQSLAMGLSFCLLAVLALPQINVLASLGPYAFTIYLYHVFGTSGARQALHAVGVRDIPITFAAGLAAGILLPVLLYSLAARDSRLRRLVL